MIYNQNYENYENPIIECANHENHEIHNNALQNNEKHEHVNIT